MRDDLERIQDILEAIEKIERHARQGRDAFEKDELLQTWMVHHLQIIGEAAARLTRDFRSSHEEIPWRSIIAMRNILVHGYFEVNMEEVWTTIERDVPDLRRKLQLLIGGNE